MAWFNISNPFSGANIKNQIAAIVGGGSPNAPAAPALMGTGLGGREVGGRNARRGRAGMGAGGGVGSGRMKTLANLAGLGSRFAMPLATRDFNPFGLFGM